MFFIEPDTMMPLYLFEWQAFLPAPVGSLTFVFRGIDLPLVLALP